MGNRAVITFGVRTEDGKYLTDYESIKYQAGIYLHWNGGYDSVLGFCEYCKVRQFRGGDYGLARMTQVIANFFGGNLSIGVGVLDHMDCDNGDNGVYVLSDDFEIIDRLFYEGDEQDEYNLIEMLEEINNKQPVADKVPDGLFKGSITPVNEIRVGDEIFYSDYDGSITRCRVVGVGNYGDVVNGHDVTGIPFIDHYGEDGTEQQRKNPNNYLFGDAYIVARD